MSTSLSLYLYLVFCIAATNIYTFTHDAYATSLLYSLRVPQSTHRIQIDTIKCPVNSFTYSWRNFRAHIRPLRHTLCQNCLLSRRPRHMRLLFCYWIAFSVFSVVFISIPSFSTTHLSFTVPLCHPKMDSDGHSIGGATVARSILCCSLLKYLKLLYYHLWDRCGNMSNSK